MIVVQFQSTDKTKTRLISIQWRYSHRCRVNLNPNFTRLCIFSKPRVESNVNRFKWTMRRVGSRVNVVFLTAPLAYSSSSTALAKTSNASWIVWMRMSSTPSGSVTNLSSVTETTTPFLSVIVFLSSPKTRCWIGDGAVATNSPHFASSCNLLSKEERNSSASSCSPYRTERHRKCRKCHYYCVISYPWIPLNANITIYIGFNQTGHLLSFYCLSM